MAGMRKVLRQSFKCQNKRCETFLLLPTQDCSDMWFKLASPISLHYNALLAHHLPPTQTVYDMPFFCCEAPATLSGPACFGSDPSSTILMVPPVSSCSVEILIVGVSGLHTHNYVICFR